MTRPISPWRGFQDGLASGRLRFQRCTNCEVAVFYPRVTCPSCWSSDLDWEDSTGLGTVYSTTSIPVRDSPPRNVCLIDLDEGFRMMSRVDGIPADTVAIGDRVRVEVAPAEGGGFVPSFRRLDAE